MLKYPNEQMNIQVATVKRYDQRFLAHKKNIQIHKTDSAALTNLAASLASRNLLTNGMKAWMSEVMDSASGCRKSSSPSTFCIGLRHIEGTVA
jgi:hypothetical protein